MNVVDTEGARIVPKQVLLHVICAEEQESIAVGVLAPELWNAKHVMDIQSVKLAPTIPVPVIAIVKHVVAMAKSDATDAMVIVMKYVLNVVVNTTTHHLIQLATVVAEPVR